MYINRHQPRASAALPRSAMIHCAAIVALAVAAGCNQQMDNQPRLDPLEESEFFKGSSSRDWVAGTVARGNSAHEITTHSVHFLTGMRGESVAAALPAEVTDAWTTEQLLARGQERYGIFCSHCHDLQGHGQGIVPQRGFPEPPTFHSDRLREAPLGHIYRVIQHGRGQMPPHGGQIPPEDRWAIAAYVRALQVSQHADAALLQAAELQSLNQQPAAETP